MSKITQALEKAARERLQRTRKQEIIIESTAPVPVPVTRSRVGEISSAGEVHVDAHIVSVADTDSPIAEQYRILRTNLQALQWRQGARVIAVTSAVNSEGKSVTAANLALTLARQEHVRVVLVDADMRKSSIPKWLGLKDRSMGLSTVLQNGGELNGSLLRLESPRLAILPAGPVPDQPAELLGSTNMKRVLASLKTQFDIIVIDVPPLLPVADPRIVAAQADGVLLVVRAGKTQRKTVLQAHEMLTQMKVNLVGCVLTHVEHYRPGYHRYYHYYREAEKQQGNGRKKSASPKPPVPAERGSGKTPAGAASA